MSKPDGLGRYLKEEKSRMDKYFFNTEQRLDFENDDGGEEEDKENMELEEINVTI